MNSAFKARIRGSTPADAPRVMDVWRRAVDATHDFLTPEDRIAIESEVNASLRNAALEVAVDEADRVIGFMLIDGGHMGALFVDPEVRGCGVGRLLLEEAIRRCPQLSAEVNEENRQAIGFYEHLGFERIGRSPLDGQGRPYPLIHLRYGKQPL